MPSLVFQCNITSLYIFYITHVGYNLRLTMQETDGTQALSSKSVHAIE